MVFKNKYLKEILGEDLQHLDGVELTEDQFYALTREGFVIECDEIDNPNQMWNDFRECWEIEADIDGELFKALVYIDE